MQQILSKMRAAAERFSMIEPGGKIAVGVSGGKDSLLLLCAMSELRRFYPVPFDLVALTIDPQFSGDPSDYSEIQELCRRLKVPYHIRRSRLGEIVFSERKEKNPCSLCARMRRGMLHNMALEAGCGSIALGHHFDDAAETFFMNLMYQGKLGCFSPKSYLSNKGLWLIRPMVFCEEKEIASAARRLSLPVQKSRCPVDGATTRQQVKELMESLSDGIPDLKQKVVGAMQRAHLDGWE